jgi:peroxiredoxin
MRLRLTVLGLGLLALLACTREVEVLDLNGRPVRPLASPAARAVVLVFTAIDCPISNRYAPELQRLYERFGPKGVRFWLVFADPREKAEAVRRHVADYGYRFPALRDPEHALVRLTGASVTPEAVVFVHDTAGPRRAYRGRIDDWYVDFGLSRAAPTTHDLQDALDAILAGRPVPAPTTRAVGCAIAGLE